MTLEHSTPPRLGPRAAIAPFSMALALSVPVGTLLGASAGVLLGLAAALAGSAGTAAYFIGLGALVGLATAAIAAAGGLVAALVVHRSRFAAVGRSLVVLADGLAVLLAAFFFGVVVLGYGQHAGGAYLWGVAAVVLMVITWICAGVLTSNRVSSLRPRRARQSQRSGS